MTATPRAKYLAEMQHLTARFEELAMAFTPVAGEIDTITISVLVARRLMDFCQSNLSRMKRAAEYLPDEALAEILAASAGSERRGAPMPIPAEDVVQWTD
jgi:hypothetical protein